MSDMVRLVSKAELLWVVDARAPIKTSAVAELLPITQNSVYVRLRHLKRSGYLHTLQDSGRNATYEWDMTAAGRQRLADADLPDAESTDFEAYFANRDNTMDPLMILEALSVEDGEWHPSGVVYDALPFSKYGIRKRLHSLTEDGLLELQPNEASGPHHWRLTTAGQQRLANADAREAGHSPEYTTVD